jgi:hypothetical protein
VTYAQVLLRRDALKLLAGSSDIGNCLGRNAFLSNDEQLTAPLDFTAKRESREISDILGASILRGPSSVDTGWKNFVVDRRTIQPCEKPELKLQHHFLILWDVRVADGESAYRSGDSPLTGSIRPPSQPVFPGSGRQFAVDSRTKSS